MDPVTDVPQEMLREWLRSERRLGVPHWAVVPARAPVAGAEPGPVAPTRPEIPVVRREEPREATPRSAAARSGAAAQTVLALTAADAGLPALCSEELPPDDASARLAELDANYVRGCTRCRLHEHRTQTVFGVGAPRAELVFVGEGPGADEDAQGLPFVGRAGQLLTRMIAAMTFTREQVYICNVVKCRPPGNRTPMDDEMETCSPFLFRQLAVLRPKVIVALGRPATQTLLVTTVAISRLRGRFHDFPPPALAHLGLPAARLMPTYHPAYLLRNPAAKAEAWADLQEVMRALGRKVPRAK